jgi:hypothetical protein
VSDTLKVDTEVLRVAGSNLRLVAKAFNNAEADSAQAGAACGHEDLRKALASFASNWDDRRARIMESLAAVAEACVGIGEGFEQLDTELAAALTSD